MYSHPLASRSGGGQTVVRLGRVPTVMGGEHAPPHEGLREYGEGTGRQQGRDQLKQVSEIKLFYKGSRIAEMRLQV